MGLKTTNYKVEDYNLVLPTAYAKITNNGALPQAEVTEGGGLSSLRTRIEKRKGTMAVRIKPVFELTVAVPINKEEIS